MKIIEIYGRIWNIFKERKTNEHIETYRKHKNRMGEIGKYIKYIVEDDKTNNKC